MDTTPKTQSMKEIVHKIDLTKSESFMKDSAKRVKRQATDWKKNVFKNTPDKGVLYNIYQEYFKLNINTTKTQF
jgi:hypothetical protein